MNVKQIDKHIETYYTNLKSSDGQFHEKEVAVYLKEDVHWLIEQSIKHEENELKDKINDIIFWQDWEEPEFDSVGVSRYNVPNRDSIEKAIRFAVVQCQQKLQKSRVQLPTSIKIEMRFAMESRDN